MGTKFFHSSAGKMQTSGTNLAARAFGSSNFQARSSGGSAQKDLGAAKALAKAQQSQRGSAYAPGPKKV